MNIYIKSFHTFPFFLYKVWSKCFIILSYYSHLLFLYIFKNDRTNTAHRQLIFFREQNENVQNFLVHRLSGVYYCPLRRRLRNIYHTDWDLLNIICIILYVRMCGQMTKARIHPIEYICAHSSAKKKK